uniref:Uncharacterized protein n=1 Tax=Oryza punctata TaxID=4537 RepID=A0A0E0LWL0_ORYPU
MSPSQPNLVVVLYVSILRLIGYESWEWLAMEVKVGSKVYASQGAVRCQAMESLQSVRIGGYGCCSLEMQLKFYH